MKSVGPRILVAICFILVSTVWLAYDQNVASVIQASYNSMVGSGSIQRCVLMLPI